jgi:transcriptional antiterminator RfaH
MPSKPTAAVLDELTHEGPWYVCHTRPRCEKKFAALMAAESFEHYLPLVTSVRRYQEKTKRFSKPLFPGYVFARIPATGKTRIYQLKLLAKAIQVSDEAQFLKQLEDVRTMVSSGVEFTVVPLLTHGRRVKIVGGPLQGLEGIVADSSNSCGIVIAVDVLRQGLLIKLPADRIRPVD